MQHTACEINDTTLALGQIEHVRRELHSALKTKQKVVT